MQLVVVVVVVVVVVIIIIIFLRLFQACVFVVLRRSVHEITRKVLNPVTIWQYHRKALRLKGETEWTYEYIYIYTRKNLIL